MGRLAEARSTTRVEGVTKQIWTPFSLRGDGPRDDATQQEQRYHDEPLTHRSPAAFGNGQLGLVGVSRQSAGHSELRTCARALLIQVPTRGPRDRSISPGGARLSESGTTRLIPGRASNVQTGVSPQAVPAHEVKTMAKMRG